MLLAVALLLVGQVAALSSGKVSSCDADSGNFGCPPGKWQIDADGKEVRSNCSEKSRYMTWVNETVPGLDKFKIFAGSNEDATLTEYVPGQRMLINVRVLKYGWTYRGLLLYAVDSKMKKVGTFDLIDRQPILSTVFCPQSVIHIGAELKPYLVTVGFTAPPAGTGNISFSSLIKVGVANIGEFYSANRLVLTEAKTAAPAQTWYRSTVAGASCDEVCTSCGGTCTAADLKKIDSPAAIDSLVSPYAFCSRPYMLRCGAEGATSGGDGDGSCFYRNETACAALGMTTTATTCAFKPSATATATAFRLCPCAGASKCTAAPATTTATTTTAKPTVTVTTVKPTTTTTATTTTATAAPGSTLPTTTPMPTTAAPTEAPCKPGVLGCKCNSGQCEDVWKCAKTSETTDVCTVPAPCLYGELGCACSTDGACKDKSLKCDPSSLKCILSDRTMCDDAMNGVKGCWCRENHTCDAGLKCDSTHNCILDVEFVCEGGQAGCRCNDDMSCESGARCAMFGSDTVCVSETMNIKNDPESSAASLLLSLAMLCVALVAAL